MKNPPMCKKYKVTETVVNIIDICKNMLKFWNIMQEDRCNHYNGILYPERKIVLTI